MEKWVMFPMFCCNCGTLNYGVQRDDGKVRYECSCCSARMLREDKNRRHQTIDLYAPTKLN